MKRLLLFVVFCLVSYVCSAQKFTVKVVAISDGDTFTAINGDNLQLKFRVIGIDAPENKQAFGNKAKEYLSSLIFGKFVTVDVQTQDSWGRYIANVYTPNGEDVSALMLLAGMAWHFVKFDDTPAYSAAEAKAKKGKLGLWVDKSPIAPWDFRAQSKQK